jgi:4-hydroxyphenylpyruvate dioxygenase-like putative hemolysin
MTFAPDSTWTLHLWGACVNAGSCTTAHSGEFLHVYTQKIEWRFYIKLLQRIGDHDGYGAPNTHIRLAAHALAQHRSS